MDVEDQVLSVLAHHGVLGMKWGHSGGGSSRYSRTVTKNRARIARNLNKNLNQPAKIALTRVHNKSVSGINHDLAHLNTGHTAKTWKRGYLLGTVHHPSKRQYDAKVTNIVHKHYQKSVDEIYGKHYPHHDIKVVRVKSKMYGNKSRFQIKATPHPVIHADTIDTPDIVGFEVEFIRDENGLVTGVQLVPEFSNSIEQAEAFVKSYLGV